jgi:integrase
MLNTATDRRHDRRPLSDDEFARLIQAAEAGPPIDTITGPDRAMMYVLAAWTGYRRGELASLTRRSVDLESAQPSVAVEAAYSKRRRQDSIPLHPEVARRLRAWLAGRELADSEPLFDLKTFGGCWRKTAKMMRLDLERAGSPYQDEDGLFADFHANRHTFITNLGRGNVSLVMAQTLARHSDPKLTASTYTHLSVSDQTAAIGMLTAPPIVVKTEDEPEVLRATGTEDIAPDPK